MDGLCETSAIEWKSVVVSDTGKRLVAVLCPSCGKRRWLEAKRVRYLLKVGKFSGRCVKHRIRHVDSRHWEDLVNWNDVAVEGAAKLVSVRCPVCNEWRYAHRTGVYRAIREGRFTGRCLAHRCIARQRAGSAPRPSFPGVDWSDTQLVEVGGGRRRSFLRLRCPVCGDVRLRPPNEVISAINRGKLRLECPAHRAAGDGAKPAEGQGTQRLAAVAS